MKDRNVHFRVFLVQIKSSVSETAEDTDFITFTTHKHFNEHQCLYEQCISTFKFSNTDMRGSEIMYF